MSWRLARSLAQLQDELDDFFPNRTKPDWTIGDAAHVTRASDHNPNDRGVVCAIDVRGRAVAQYLWNYIVSAKDPRVKYAIFNHQIVNSTVQPWVVRPYRGSNPHTDHIHVSVGRGASGESTRPDLYDNVDTWGISSVDSLENFVSKLNDKQLAVLEKVVDNPKAVDKLLQLGDYLNDPEHGVENGASFARQLLQFHRVERPDLQGFLKALDGMDTTAYALARHGIASLRELKARGLRTVSPDQVQENREYTEEELGL